VTGVGRGPPARRQRQIFLRQRRVKPRVEENVGNKVALVRARARAARDRVQDIAGRRRAQDGAQVVIVVAHVAEALRARLARIHLTGLVQHQVQSPGITIDQPPWRARGAQDQPPLHDVLGGLEAPTAEGVDRRDAAAQLVAEALCDALVLVEVHVLVAGVGEFAAHQRDRVRADVLQARDEIGDRLHVILIRAAEHRVHAELELGIAIEQRRQPLVGFDDLGEAAGRAAQPIVRLADAVERELDRDDAARAVAQNSLGLLGDQLGHQAIGGVEHDRRAIAPVEDAADLGQVAAQEWFAPGEGEPQQAPEAGGDPFDLGQRQLRRVRRGRVRAREVEAERTARVALAGDEEGELDRPALPQDRAQMTQRRVHQWASRGAIRRGEHNTPAAAPAPTGSG